MTPCPTAGTYSRTATCYSRRAAYSLSHSGAQHRICSDSSAILGGSKGAEPSASSLPPGVTDRGGWLVDCGGWLVDRGTEPSQPTYPGCSEGQSIGACAAASHRAERHGLEPPLQSGVHA